MAKSTTDRSPRILITRLSHIGDCVLTLPVLCALRAKFPNAFIAWAVEKPSDQLLSLHTGLDQIIQIPKGWLGKPSQWLALRRELRSYRFDITIDPQSLNKSALLGYLSGAKQRIGLSGRWAREQSKLLNNSRLEPIATHVVDRSLALLSLLGIESPEASFDLPVDLDAKQQIDAFLCDEKVQQPFAVINPGASWASKRWDNDRFAAVANHLGTQHGMRSVVTWAGDAELEMAKSIAAASRNFATVARQTSLRAYAALCQQATMFIGCDTGPMHIAAAMGTPCIGLYGPTLPTESGAYGDQHEAVQKWHQAGSSRERRNAQNVAMMDITPEDVCAACDRLLARA